MRITESTLRRIIMEELAAHRKQKRLAEARRRRARRLAEARRRRRLAESARRPQQITAATLNRIIKEEYARANRRY
jgi:hypothetical protein